MMRSNEASPTWGSDLEAVLCDHCDWRYLVSKERLPRQCPHCFQATLTGPDTSGAAEPDQPPPDHLPELFLPFSVPADVISQRIQHFAGDIWFAPGDLTPHNLQARLQRTYLPMWLVDSRVEAAWQAEVGFNYETVSHRDYFDDNRGGWFSEQISETRIRWEPRLGQLSRTYHNIPAPALEEHFELAGKLGRFDLQAGQPYGAQALDQSSVCLPNRSPADAWPDTTPDFQAAAGEECRRAARADHIREYRWSAAYHDQNWTLLLLPLYSTYYLDDDRQPQPVLIHGQTGQIAGPRRASMKRAQQAALFIIAVATILFILSLAVAAASIFVPPLIVAAAAGILLAIVVGMAAIAPVVIAWQTNRSLK